MCVIHIHAHKQTQSKTSSTTQKERETETESEREDVMRVIMSGHVRAFLPGHFHELERDMRTQMRANAAHHEISVRINTNTSIIIR